MANFTAPPGATTHHVWEVQAWLRVGHDRRSKRPSPRAVQAPSLLQWNAGAVRRRPTQLITALCGHTYSDELAQQRHVPARRDQVPDHRRVHEQDHVGPYSLGGLRAPTHTTGWCSQKGHVLLSPPAQRGSPRDETLPLRPSSVSTRT